MAQDSGDGLGAAVGRILRRPVEKVGDKLKATASQVIDKKIKEAGGPGGIAKEALKRLIPGFGAGENLGDGVGKGRRMPVQQAIDIGVPVTEAYNHFTQFEEWPKFMHRVQNVSQDDETQLKFGTKIWLFKREFTAEIEEQVPDERIEWHVTEGITHHGVATFHELAPRLTRVDINVDVAPSGLIEKSGRGMRHVKRAIRADLHRFKAYVMMNPEPEAEWRGTIEDAEVIHSAASDDSSAQPSDTSWGQARAARSSSRRSGSSSNRAQSSPGSNGGEPSSRVGADRRKSGTGS